MVESFNGPYQTLIDIRNKLEKLSLTQAWSLRETDLYDYQRQLDKLDESRIDGNFVDADGVFAELYVQRVSCVAQFTPRDLLMLLDTSLPHQTKLCIHLLSDGILRTGVRGSSTGLQPTPDAQKVSY